MAAVDIEGLSYRYTDAEAVLRGIDLRIADGEAHAILGGSGAGKTTLLHLLAGLLQPQTGIVRFDGQDVTGVGGAARNVAQVFQFPVLYPSLNVAGNIGFALGNRGWPKAAVRTRVGEVAELLELAPLLQSKPDTLSLFEKQLVAIARALASPDTSVVLLDEPLTAVEPATKWRLRRAIKTVQQELALTMVYVTHDQSEALTFAETITMLHQGAVLQTGTPLELYERPAHTAVAGFIGSPGMNLVDAEANGGRLRIGHHPVATGQYADGACVAGFRPEWARIAPMDSSSGGGITVDVEGIRILGTEEGEPVGLVTARLGETVVHVRQRLDGLPVRGLAATATAATAATSGISATIATTGTSGTAATGDDPGTDREDQFDKTVGTCIRIDPARLVAYRDGRLMTHAG